MNPMSRLLTAVLLGLVALVGAPDAAALPRAQKVVPQERPVVPEIRYSLDQAIAIARRASNATAHRRPAQAPRGHVTHEVKILTEGGAVHVVRVDGASGRVSH